MEKQKQQNKTKTPLYPHTPKIKTKTKLQYLLIRDNLLVLVQQTAKYHLLWRAVKELLASVQSRSDKVRKKARR